jgi:8-oxo-dGTP diphosphatase
MADILQRIAMKAVIVKDGKVLVLREAETNPDGTKAGKYQFPGGRIEPGEAFEDALHREVMEESGLTVAIEYPIHVGEWRPIIKGVQNQIVAVFFVCSLVDGVVRLSIEHDEFKWIDPDDANFAMMVPEGEVLKRYADWSKRLGKA